MRQADGGDARVVNRTALNPGGCRQVPQMVQMAIGLGNQHEIGHGLQRAQLLQRCLFPLYPPDAPPE